MTPQPNPYNRKYFVARNTLDLPTALIIRNFLHKEKAKHILDVGCGTGKMVKYFNRVGFNAAGCDRSPVACRISGQTRADATALPYPARTFKAVLLLSLIEHLSRQAGQQSIMEACRVLKPNGILLIITPNRWSPNRFMQGKKWFAYSDPTHLTYYSPLDLAMLLRQNGFSQIRFTFEVPSYQAFTSPFFNPQQTRWPEILIDAATRLFIASPLALFRDSFWIAGKKSSQEKRWG